MLRKLKILALRSAQAAGLSAPLMRSAWRRNRLLILCYHGISLDDEEQWDSSLYMRPSLFRSRMEAIRNAGCRVLALSEAIDRLYAGTLPPASVALTFDDGTHDFYRLAFPILSEFKYPVTVYLTTYYSDFNRPVFDVMCSYLLWKGRGKSLVWPELLREPVELKAGGLAGVVQEIKDRACERGLSGPEKDALLASLAERLEINYEALCAKRILHIMTADEVRQVAAAGADIQLHTHRHRVSMDRDRFQREISDNRERIAAISPAPAVHFCYPGGFRVSEFPGWLRESCVVSATTCENGIATPNSDRMALPRLVDTSTLTGTEFSAWLSGLASFLPRRAPVMSSGQLIEGERDAARLR
jgi:peptidoglycan/xylan/chitin deacetylase (PgdA/CDA1 family)